MIAIEKEHDENHETYRVPNEITFSKDGELVEHLNRGKK